MKERSRALFRTPFSLEYWKLALSEIRHPKILAVAGILLALRIAVKPLSIPIPLSQDLYFSFDFIVNSVAAMITGPVVSTITGAISDTIGAFLFPKGPYFFPYIFIRVMLGRFFVSLLSNIALGAWISYYYYQTFYPKSLPLWGARQAAGIVKNLALFPLEALVLLLLIGALLPVTNKTRLCVFWIGKYQLLII